MTHRAHPPRFPSARIASALLLINSASLLLAQTPSPDAAIDAYLRPYVASNNFSGAVLVERHNQILFQKAYGFADRDHKIPNTIKTRFHIASVSMQFSAAAVLRLVDQRALALDDPIGPLVPGVPGSDRITVRDLLAERSGLPDINALPAYIDLLQHHQTPASLVAAIGGLALLFPPGSQYLHEEHSAYNVLALLIEQKTGLPFAAAMHRLLFQPAGLNDSFLDDDLEADVSPVARGDQPVGVDGLEAAPVIHWSAKSGNASVCTTVADQARWIRALFTGALLGAASRKAMLDPAQPIGYGWFKRPNPRFSELAYFMNGRAPGFASFVLYLPREDLTVVAFSNVYSSATTDIGYDIAAIALSLPNGSFQSMPLTAADLASTTGTFQFGPDFYQKNAQLTIVSVQGDLSLRWPGGSLSPLIPQSPDHFIDRSYWEPVTLERDSAHQPVALVYDCFRGTVVPLAP
ncbi:MAG TPA: serine hydrolase domain-containing protein [Acidobacteriaceae bacterium]|jgi:CubicO group peptidase (beta-lactamase class C family)|nr:serine hydrolase domain-containing protein [Acidobacteriaceae bacterium]